MTLELSPPLNSATAAPDPLHLAWHHAAAGRWTTARAILDDEHCRAAHTPADIAAVRHLLDVLHADSIHGDSATPHLLIPAAHRAAARAWQWATLYTDVACGNRSQSDALEAGASLGEARTHRAFIAMALTLDDTRELLRRGHLIEAHAHAETAEAQARHLGMEYFVMRARQLWLTAAAFIGTSCPPAVVTAARTFATAAGATDLLLAIDRIDVLESIRQSRHLDAAHRLAEMMPRVTAHPRSHNAALLALDLADISTSTDYAGLRPITEQFLAVWDPRVSALHETAHLALLSVLHGDAAPHLARSAARAAATSGHHLEAARMTHCLTNRLPGHHPDQHDMRLRVRGDFTRFGATAWARRVGAETDEDIETSALTEQELKIATLAAAGFTNKQVGAQLFLSPRTVSGHLYRVFPKLGITSRAALRDALTMRGLR